MMNEEKQSMKNEIEKRMASDLWSRTVASAVLKRRKKRQRIVYGLSGLATAACIMVVSVFTLQTGPGQTTQYSDFITLQVQGIHKSSLQKDIVKVSENTGTTSGVLFSSAVDDVIDDAIY